jgi:hypothetical protein
MVTSFVAARPFGFGDVGPFGGLGCFGVFFFSGFDAFSYLG